jgi:hypothetical protein
MKSDIHVWIKTFFKTWPALMWLVLKVVLMSCSASTFEHNWSIEGWIHSNRRNRIGQKIVHRLVHTHTNLKLEERLEMYTGPPTESLTPCPSLNPNKTLTNFLCNLE